MPFDYDQIYYKIIRSDKTHGKMKYDIGLNVDVIPFRASNKCEEGGLYFTTRDKISLYTGFGSLLATITIPKDALVHPMVDKFKADRIMILEMIDIADSFLITEYLHDVIKRNPYVFPRIKNPTSDMCKVAISICPGLIDSIKNPSHEILIIAISEDPRMIKDVDQTDNLCKIAIGLSNGHAIKYIRNQTTEMCKLAIDQSLYVLNMINNLTDELCLYAYDLYGEDALLYILNPNQREHIRTMVIPEYPHRKLYEQREIRLRKVKK